MLSNKRMWMKTVVFLFVLALTATLSAQQAAPDKAEEKTSPLLKGMRYRLVGPYRGGRALAVVGVRGEPNTYYFGAVAGGVWKDRKSVV